MKVLITGGAGFIGSHVAEQMLKHGHQVAIIDDLSSGKRDNLPEGAVFYEADIRSGCGRIFADFKPEALCHHAAQIDVRRSVAEPEFDADINALGTVRLLEDCVRYGVGKVLFASTGGAIYGKQQQFPATEDHPQYPLSPYGVSKLAAERYLHYYRVQYGLPYVALRYANVYGPRQDPHGEAGVVAIFCQRLTKGEVPTINGSGEQTRDYVYVSEVARANVLALEGNVPSGSYNIGTAQETSVNRLYELLARATGSSLEASYDEAKPGEQARSSLDPTKAERVLGWRLGVELAHGLEETAAFFGAWRKDREGAAR